ncbi:MAG: ATP-binding protein [Bacteroidota bacterium]
MEKKFLCDAFFGRDVQREIVRLNKTGLFNTSLDVKGSIPTIDSNTTIILYRMLQEILNNSIKHANATSIKVQLEDSGNLFTLVCRDDGVGFDLNDPLCQNGSGLSNLHNRAKLINASLSIRSAPGQTVVTIELPL